MSSYLVLSAVSNALRDVLWEAYDADPVIRGIVGSQAAIVHTNPTQTAQNPANRLSLWLYQVTENEFVKNYPPQRANGHDTTVDTPLALNLSYLLTPFAPSGELDHLLLGITMRVFYDNAIVYLRSTADDIYEELRIILCRLSLEELAHIWEALREPYRLSVCYQVRITHINSQQLTQRARVIEVDSDYSLVRRGLEHVPGA
jgi:hypothetical protein